MSFHGEILCGQFLLPILFTFFLLFHPSFSMLGNITDEHALLAFKADLISDPFQVTTSWNVSTPFCKWTGITCGRRHQRVVKINLTSSNLQGSLSPAIGNLSFLRMILLDTNSFTGKIPSEIGGLLRLQILHLANNSFSGEIPNNISRCWNLKDINLASNYLTGKLPVQFQSLSELQIMRVFRNKLTGKIPPQYGNLSSLVWFGVEGNNLHGVVPNSFGKLKNLRHIILHNNFFSGTLLSLSNLSLVDIDLQSNQLEGGLPRNMSNTFPILEFLSVFQNRLVGYIPLWVSNAARIKVLDLSDNNFTGQVPNFGNFKHLRALSLYKNEHIGSGTKDLRFMAPLTNCTDLEYLDFSDCNFRGNLPPYIGNISNLKIFDIRDNHISGKIPIEIGQLINLEQLLLMGNQLSGTIPNTIGKLRNLYYLILEGNQLSGEIPSSLENVTLLSDLTLGSNNLEGAIPSGLAKCKFLLEIHLFANNLSGYIPKEFFHSDSELVIIDIADNSLKSPLPLEIGGLKSLTFLNLSSNSFFGELPPTFSSLTSVETLDLSSNHLTGKIPSFLENLRSFMYLSLSNNDLEGEVPVRGIFGNKSGVFLEGNSKLCGGVPELHFPRCNIKEITKKSRMSLGLKMGISISCGILGSVLVVLFIGTYLHRRRKKSTSLQNQTKIKVMPMVSYKTLHDATNGFSKENLIGFGKFSSVYRGNLDEQGKVVAIKVLKLQVKGASKSFIAECDALRHIRHRNLVKVVSSCSSIDHQGNDFKAIVYEYMEEGNLETWLHHPHHHTEPTHLSLLERVNIAMDIACALDYLHAECGTTLVHCDLKPNNVLLDCDLVAHVSDFGLARFLPEAAYTSSAGVKGTFGYAAPEYGLGNEFSTSGDMYSYGILLLEIFTGKSPTDDIFANGLNLHEYVKIALPHRVMEIADPTLLYRKEDSSSKSSQISPNKVVEILLSVLGIGIACSVNSSSERMNACTAMNKLRTIKSNLLGTRQQ
ncbi:receptor kinase-like protein Xa21 [Ipomoea triloba]|uniref:receptor kinase-like protein Xa21 n=1 Tax=Ipomoea triloba TaxID=35885 RepID=UPI00125DCE3B|nr:receptor kinase-like protein Xa21 [Ipomoea triloba]